MAKRLQRIAVLSVLAVLAAAAGWLLGAGRAAAEGQEPSGFVIHADKVVGTLDLGGIVLKMPVLFTGDMPIAFMQAKIYGMTLTKQQTMAGHTVSFTFHTDQATQTKWLKMRVKKLKIGGLCTDGVPLVEQCLKDVTVVATELTADELAIPQLSASAAFGAAPADSGGSPETASGQQPEAPSGADEPPVKEPDEPAPQGEEPPASAPDDQSGSAPPASAPDDQSGSAPPASAPDGQSGSGPGSQPGAAPPLPTSDGESAGGGNGSGSSPEEGDSPAAEPEPPPSSSPGTNPVGGLIESITEKQEETSRLIEEIKEAVQDGLNGEAAEGVEKAVNDGQELLDEQLKQINAALEQTKAQLENAQRELADKKEAAEERMGPLPLLDANEAKKAIEQTAESIRQHEAQLEQLQKLKQQLEKQAKELSGWLGALP